MRLDERLTIAEHDHVTTAGAAFAHIGLALTIVMCQSPDLAERVARHLLIGDRPSRAFFCLPAQLASSDPRTSAFEQWVRHHLDKPLQISAVAGEIGMSDGTLRRATSAVLGMTPIDFVHEIHLDQAFLLRTTQHSPEKVARSVGYQNVSTLRALSSGGGAGRPCASSPEEAVPRVGLRMPAGTPRRAPGSADRAELPTAAPGGSAHQITAPPHARTPVTPGRPGQLLWGQEGAPASAGPRRGLAPITRW